MQNGQKTLNHWSPCCDIWKNGNVYKERSRPVNIYVVRCRCCNIIFKKIFLIHICLENRHHIKTTALNLVLFLVVCFIADLAVNSRHFFLIFFCILSLIFVHYIMNILICGPDERKKNEN